MELKDLRKVSQAVVAFAIFNAIPVAALALAARGIYYIVGFAIFAADLIVIALTVFCYTNVRNAAVRGHFTK